MNTELEWLRYFYGNAHCGMGPASDEIYSMIKESYLNSGGGLFLWNIWTKTKMSYDKWYSWRWILVDQWKYRFLFHIRQLDKLLDKYLGN